MNELISVIIPIYNCEKYIEKCIKSVCKQTYENLEILLINDGSTDSSESICQKYKNIDKRIKYIYKQNSGVSDTRNLGIKKSSGKYIMFIDSDDYIDDDYIKKMYNCFQENIDIVVSGYRFIDLNTNNVSDKKCYDQSRILEFTDYIDKFINTNYFSQVWKMLIKKESLPSFQKNLKFAEDLLFVFHLLKNRKIYYLPICGYNYISNPYNVTNNNSIATMLKYAEDNNYVFDQMSKEQANYENEYNVRLLNKINLRLINLVNNVSYREFKKSVISVLDILNISKKKINLSKNKYITKGNKIRCTLLIRKMLFTYYLFNKIRNIF